MRFSDHKGLDLKDIQIIDGMFTTKPTQGPGPESAAQIPAAKKEGFDIAATSHLARTPITHRHMMFVTHKSTKCDPNVRTNRSG